MPGEIWRGQVRAALEVVAGVPVSPATRILYFTNPVFDEAIEDTPNEFATGTRDNVRSHSLGASEVSGTAEHPLSPDEILEDLLIAIQGAVTPTTPTGATNGRLWTFAPGSVAPDAMTAEWHDGVRVWQAAGVMANMLTIAGNVRERNMVTMDLFGTALNLLGGGLSGAPASRTPTVTQGYETLVYLDAFGAAPGSSLLPGTAVNWSIKFGNQLEREYTADNTRFARGVNVGTLDLNDMTFLMRGVPTVVSTEIDNWRAGTARMLRLEFGHNLAITGDTAVNEVQSWSVTGTATAGSITATFLGVSFTMTFNQAAAALSTTLNAALIAAAPWLGVGGNPLLIGGGPWPATPITVTAQNALAARDIPLPLLVTNALTGTTPAPAFAVTTPGYSAKKFVRFDIPGVWTAVSRGSTNASARAYEFTYGYQYDPTNGFGFRAQVQNARTAAW